MSRNNYTYTAVAVAGTVTSETDYLAPTTNGVWRDDEGFLQRSPSRLLPLDPEAIDRQFQHVLGRFKRVEERRFPRSTTTGCGCWHSPTTPSPWATEPTVAPTESRALWLLNNCQMSRQTELKMIEANHVRQELDASFGGQRTPTTTQPQQSQAIDWPAPPPPPRPYSPGPMPWMEPSSFEPVSRVVTTETEARVEGIPTRISRAARRRMAQPTSSYAQVPETASMGACLLPLHSPPLSQSYPWGATATSAHANHRENTVPTGTLTETLRPPLPASRVDTHAARPPMLDIESKTTKQPRSADRLHTAVDWRLGKPVGSKHTVTPSDGGATYGGGSPLSRGLHTPEEIMPWTERRVNYGCGTWVIHGPSDVGVRPRPAPPGFPALSYDHATGTMRYEEGLLQPTWDPIKQEAEELSRKAAAYRRVLVDNGLWEALRRR
ncbi:hypothetical protein V8D89_009757 [Ganoderma adspersum]